MRTLLLPAIALFSACFGPSNDAYYLRFEQVGTLPGAARTGGLYDGFGIGDRVFVQYGTELTEILPGGNVKVADALRTRAKGTSVFALRADGVYRSDDLVTFTKLSDEVFDDLRPTSDGLVAGRDEDSLGAGTVHRSDDGGVTWRKLADVRTPVSSESGSTNFSVLGSVGPQAWVQMSGDANLGDNFAANFAGYSVLGDAVTQEWMTGTAYKGPMLASSSGLVAYDLGNNGNESRFDRLTGVGVTDGAQRALEFQDIPRVHFVTVPMANNAESRLLGIDDQDRLLIAIDSGIYRSKKAFTRANNERNEILRGPGCQERSTFERGRDRDDDANVTVQNRSGRAIRLHRVDFLHRVSLLADVADGAETEVRLGDEDHLLAIDATDETCLGFHFPPAEESTLTINAP